MSEILKRCTRYHISKFDVSICRTCLCDIQHQPRVEKTVHGFGGHLFIIHPTAPPDFRVTRISISDLHVTFWVQFGYAAAFDTLQFGASVGSRLVKQGAGVSSAYRFYSLWQPVILRFLSRLASRTIYTPRLWGVAAVCGRHYRSPEGTR